VNKLLNRPRFPFKDHFDTSICQILDRSDDVKGPRNLQRRVAKSDALNPTREENFDSFEN
jgi:hypothetical protein